MMLRGCEKEKKIATTPSRPAQGGLQRWLSAAAVGLAVALLWLVVLPWLGDCQPIRQHVDALHAADINASAMFYSELECGYMLRD